MNGSKPAWSLLQASNGLLYGTTVLGSTNNPGVEFSYDISTNIFTKLTDFNDTIGRRPGGPLIEIATITTSIPTLSPPTISIYPNPATSHITIKNLPPNSQITLTDILGDEILTQTTKTNLLTTINISQLSRGVYLLHLKNSNESLVKRLIAD